VLLEQAKAADADMPRWADALNAARRAEGRLGDGSDHAELRQQVRELLARLEAEQAAWQARQQDRRMLARLADIRQQSPTDPEANFFDSAPADTAYEQAFREYGIDVEKLPAAEAARRLRERPIRAALVAGLDHWAYVRRNVTHKQQPAVWRRLIAVAQSADPDPWRQRLRAARDEPDSPTLLKLAADANIVAQPPHALHQLGLLLLVKGEVATAAVFLRRAQQIHPGDFDLNNTLAVCAEHFLEPPRPDEALRHYTAALAANPRSAGAYLNLGHALGELKRWDEALAAYAMALRLKPDYTMALVNRGWTLAEKGDFAQARDAYLEVLRRWPNHAQTLGNLGVVWGNLGQADKALAALRRAIELDPDSSHAHFNLGLLFAQQGQLGPAKKAFRKAIVCAARDPAEEPRPPGAPFIDRRRRLQRQQQSARAYSELGLLLSKVGKRKEALGCFRESLKYRPDQAQTHYRLGVTLLEDGQPAEAEGSLRRVTKLQPDLAEAHAYLGWALHDQKKFDEAVREFGLALDLRPDLAWVHYQLGTTFHDQGKPDKARTALEKAVALKPDYAEAHCNLGSTLVTLGRPEEAVKHFRLAVKLKDDLVLAHHNLGVIWRQQGKLDKAVAAHRRAVELEPTDADFHVGLGTDLLLQAKWPEASASFAKAVSLKETSEGYWGLGFCRLRQGRVEEAVTALQKSIALKGDFAGAYTQLGIALQRQQKLAEAIAAHSKAAALQPGDAEVLCYLGRALFDQGAFAEAAAVYKRAQEVAAKDPRWAVPAAQSQKAAERMARLEARLPAILKGQDKPADAGERLALARLCLHPKRRLPLAAARFFTEAFADPKLADKIPSAARYDAACAAALAAAGQGEDTAKLDGKEREHWRRQARDWLREDLAAWAKRIKAGQHTDRTTARQVLQHWRQVPDLTGVREPAAIAKLPVEERTAWRQLWADVEALLRKAEEGQ
jgi:tetratricopeptide (TPR) repeat protein